MIFAIILLFAMCFPTFQCAMEIEEEQSYKVHKYMDIEHLLADNGKYLKKLLAIENSGTFSTDLVYTSGALKNCLPLNEHKSKKYSIEAIQLGTYISQRIDDLYKMGQAVQEEDLASIQSLVLNNPYLINARGFTTQNECPLWMAVNARKEKSVEKLLQLKANPNMCDTQGNTPLHNPGTYNIAKMLIEYGANVNKKNDLKRTPLFSQIRVEGSLDIVELLCEHNAKVNKKDYRKNTVLYKAFKYGVGRAIVALLLKYGADLESRNYKGVTPFDKCCFINYEKYSGILEERGYLYIPPFPSDYINPFDLLRDNGEYLIELAKKPLGSFEWTRAKKGLLKLQAYMQASIARSQQARYRSVFQCQVEGIFVNQRGCFLKNALNDDCRYFFGEKNIDRMYTILQERSAAENKLDNAIIHKKESKLQKIIKKYGVAGEHQHRLMKLSIQGNNNNELSFYLKCGFDPNACEWSWAPLLLTAIEKDNAAALQLLLAYGAEFIVHIVSGQTPLQYMKCLGHDECIKAWKWSLTQRFKEELINRNHGGIIFCSKMPYFLENGIDVNVAVDDEGNTALYYAAQAQCSMCIGELIKRKATIYSKGAKGYTPILQWALKNHDKEVTTLCVNEGALIYEGYIKNASDPIIKKQLQDAYDQQYCMICYDHPHPDQMREIPCINRHKNNFLCSECSDKIKKCPLGCVKGDK